MSVQCVAKDIEWTDSMQEQVDLKIVDPLKSRLNTNNFELSLHLEPEKKTIPGQNPRLEMWAVLQTFDGHGLEVVRRRGIDFYSLINDVAAGLRTQLREAKARPRFAFNPFPEAI